MQYNKEMWTGFSTTIGIGGYPVYILNQNLMRNSNTVDCNFNGLFNVQLLLVCDSS